MYACGAFSCRQGLAERLQQYERLISVGEVQKMLKAANRRCKPTESHGIRSEESNSGLTTD